MDFHDALLAHIRGTRRASCRALEPNSHLCVGLIPSAQECELGQWLAAEGNKFASFPEFADLLASHARFHQVADSVMSKSGIDQPETPDIDPLEKSDLTVASHEIAKALMAMLKKMLAGR